MARRAGDNIHIHGTYRFTRSLTVGLSFIRRTGVVSFTLVCFLSLPILPQFLSCALLKLYFRICTLYSSWVRQYFLVHTSFTSMPSEFKLNSFVFGSFIYFAAQSVNHRCNSMCIRFFFRLLLFFSSGYVFLLHSINSTLSASLENQASFIWSGRHIHQHWLRVIGNDRITRLSNTRSRLERNQDQRGRR